MNLHTRLSYRIYIACGVTIPTGVWEHALQEFILKFRCSEEPLSGGEGGIFFRFCKQLQSDCVMHAVTKLLFL